MTSRFRRPARTATHQLAFDPNDAEAIAEARADYETAKLMLRRAQAKPLVRPEPEPVNREQRRKAAKAKDSDDLEQAFISEQVQREIHEAEEKVAEKRRELEALLDELPVITFTFRAIGHDNVAKLLEEHQPTDEQIELFKKHGGQGELGYNPATYPAAHIAASCTKVQWPKTEMTGEYVRRDGGAIEYETTGGISFDEAVAMWSDPAFSIRDLQALHQKADSLDSAVTTIPELKKD